jgi:hypothetical protein
MNRTFLAASFALSLGALPLQAQTPWIHVEVDENDADASHVKVNLPLSVVEIALDAAPDKFVDKGQLHLQHLDEDLNVEDLRRMWKELRSSPDAELVSVEGKDKNQTVSVRRQGDEVIVAVDNPKEKDSVNVRVPVAVVDALFQGEGQELNLKGAISELKNLRGDVVRVDDGETKVRIWIDEKD